MFVTIIILVAMLCFGVVEYQKHLRNLNKIPIRIHVNGTRGKSSVTRLIAAGLRAGGIATCAKTTGTSPQMILEDGSEYTIQRQGRGNILEQTRTIALAVRRRVRAVVIECMAINPIYQNLSEQKMVRSSIGVITNVRADHLDIMGPTTMDVAKALAGTVPRESILVTAETDPVLLAVLKNAAALEKTRVITTTPETEGITAEIMGGFSYLEHPENVALSLRVCQTVGVGRDRALQGMWAAKPDSGVLRVHHLAFYDKRIDFVNAFAANDPDSTTAIWKLIFDQSPNNQQRVALINCRDDRVQRSIQLGEMLPRLPQLHRAIVAGRGTHITFNAALEHGLHPEQLIVMENPRPEEVFERCLAQITKDGCVVGMGNIVGLGNAIVEYFNNRAVVSR